MTMTELLVQKFLRTGGTCTDLLNKYAIKHVRHKKYPNLVLFKYSQIDSPMGEPLVWECRGTILDEDKNWDIVCFPFQKFFNHGEGHAAEIDWSGASVTEKFDGTLITLYWYADSWHVATTGTPDASGNVNDLGFTFQDLFWNTFNNLNMPMPSDKHKHYNYMFELMTQHNRVVVVHREPKIVLIGVRNLLTGYEEKIDEHARYGWAYAKRHNLDSVDNIIRTFGDIDPISQEGYVVTDRNFNRIKIKHPGYVALHQMKDGLNTKSILELVRSGDTDEVKNYFPEWTGLIDSMKSKLDRLIDDTDKCYSNIRLITSQKEFASHAVKMPVPDALFRETPKQAHIMAAILRRDAYRTSNDCT
jgi:hypothetical protein